MGWLYSADGAVPDLSVVWGATGLRTLALNSTFAGSSPQTVHFCFLKLLHTLQLCYLWASPLLAFPFLLSFTSFFSSILLPPALALRISLPWRALHFSPPHLSPLSWLLPNLSPSSLISSLFHSLPLPLSFSLLFFFLPPSLPFSLWIPLPVGVAPRPRRGWLWLRFQGWWPARSRRG